MSRPKRYLMRMTLFVIAVLILAAVLFPGLYDAFMASAVLNGVIIGLLVVGIAFTFRSVARLTPEVHWIEGYQALRDGYGVENLPQPRLLAPMARMLGERQGRLSLSAMSMRSLLDGIGARLDEGRELTRYLIGLLVFMGLLGTFWGLLRTIDAVGAVIADLSMDQTDLGAALLELKEGLAAPLRGMGTAFSASLFGLGGSLVLGFLELQASQAQNRFYNELEDWLSGVTRLSSGTGISAEGETSVPAYLQALIEQTAENLDSLRRIISQGEDGRRQSSANLMALTERLGMLTDQMRAEQTLMIKLAESQMELKPVLGRLAEAATGSNFGMDEASRQHLRNLDTYVRRLLDELPVNRDQTVTEIRSEIKLLARTIAALAEETEA
jgi:hypothetical protein